MNKESINKLQDKIKNYKELNPVTDQTKYVKPLNNSRIPFNIAIDFVAGIFVGVLIGVFLDKIFDSKPAFLIISLLLSFVATFRSIIQKYIKK